MNKLWAKMRKGVALASVLAPLNLYANPLGPQVVHGQVSFEHPDANTLSITNTPGAIVNWQSFGINAGEITQFIQQGPNSAILNRVVGQDPSALLGELRSNGQVYLVNPNGIVVGQNAVIDTAGFIASTLAISDEDFKRGELNFVDEGQAGNIVNRGFIKVGEDGNVLLVAPSITNEGVIQTDGGNLILAAGHAVTITSLDDPALQFDIQAPDNEVINLGELVVNHGAAEIFAGSITHQGGIQANSLIVDEQGRVQLVASDGITIESEASISASGNQGGEIVIDSAGDTVVNGSVKALGETTGGNVKILGERVGLFAEAEVDASGDNGGGEVLIGGDYQGANPDVQNARQTQVGDNAIVRANAKETGSGGKLIVWADDYTEFRGRAEAIAGTENGDGGFIEISGKQSLAFAGEVDASAENGAAGTVLFDPKNIDINDAGAAPVAANDEFTEAPAASVQIDPADIIAILTGGTNVTLQANNDITVTSNVSGDGVGADNFLLTLQAGRTIDIDADIDLTFADLSLIANDPAADALNRDPGAGSIFLRQDRAITSGAGFGTASLAVLNGGTVGNIELEEGSSIALFEAAADLSVASGGSIILRPAGLGAAAVIATAGGNITLTADTIDLLGATSQLQAASGSGFQGTVTLRPSSAQEIQIVTSTVGTPGVLELETGDLQNINVDGFADGFLVIGTGNTTDITIVDAFTPGGGGNAKDRVSFEGSGNLTINASLDGTGITGASSGHSFETNMGGDITINATVNTGTANGAFLFGQSGGGATASFASGSLVSPLFSITGGAGVDALVGNATLNDAYIINGAGAGNLTNPNISTVNFSSIENLNAGGGDDVFVFQTGGSLSGFADGGAGTDTADYSGIATSIVASLPTVGGTDGFDIAEASVAGNMTNMNAIIGGSNTDGLSGANIANTWNITANDTGNVNGFGFSSFENLTGGSNSDTFVFADGATVNQFNGNSTPALNTANFSAWTTDLTFTQTASDTFDVAGMTTNPNIGNVVGGAGNDTFVMSGNTLAIFNGTLDGSAGFDTLDYDTNSRSENAIIDLENGTATDIAGIINLENYVASTAASANQLIGSNAGATWVLSTDTDGTFGGNTFSNFQNVQGGTGADTFTLPDGFGGSISDSGGANAFIFTGALNSVANVAGAAGNDTFSFLGAGGAIDGTINGAGGTDVLQFNGGTYDLNIVPGAVEGLEFNTGGIGNVNVDLTVNTLQISDTGQLGGTGNITVLTGFTVSSGVSTNVIDSSGTLLLDSASVNSISIGAAGDLSIIGGGTFQNDGTLDITGALAASSLRFDNTVTVDNNGTLNVDVGQVDVESAFTNDGTISLSNGASFSGSGGSFTNSSTGALRGNGTFVAPSGLLNDGLIAPGLSIGTLNVTGDVTFNSGSTLEIEVTTGLSSDQLIATGNINLNSGAMLDLLAFGGYAGNGGDTFSNVLQAGGTLGGSSGVFDVVNQPGGFSMNPTYNAASMDLGVASALFNTWIGGLAGDWDVIANWSFGALPLAGDDVLIDTLGAVVTIDSGTNNANTLTILSGILLDVMAGSLTVQSASNIDGNLQVSGGSLTFNDASTVNGTFDWTAGNISAPGTLTLAGVTTISGGTKNLNIGTIDHTNASGSSLFSASEINLNFSTFRNSGVMGFDNGAANILIDQDTIGGGSFENLGTINKGGIGRLDISNLGSFSFTNNGALNIAAGEIFINNNHSLNGSLTGPGKLIWNSGTSEGTLNLAAGSLLEITGGGTLTAPITYNGAGDVVWNSGTITLNGFDLTANSPLTMTGGTLNLNGAGVLIHTNGSGTSVIDASQFNLNFSTFRNTAAGILEISTPLVSDEVLYDQDTIGAGVFENLGTLNKTGLGRFNVSNLGTLSFINSGTMNVPAGEIFINNTSTLNGNLTGAGKLVWNGGSSQGALNTGAGSIIELTGGTHTFAAPINYTGAGSVEWNLGGISLGGFDWTVDIPLTITGGGLSVSGPGTIVHNNGSGSSVIDATQIDLNFATFRNTAAAIIDISTPLVSDEVLYDQDTIGAGVFENLGTLNKTGLGRFNVSNFGALSFINSGTMNVSGGDIFINNTATLNGNLTGAGKIIWNGGSTQGNLNIAAGSLLEIISGTHTLSAASSYNGAGTVRWLSGIITGADLTVNTIFEVTGASEKTQNSNTIIHTNTSGSSFVDSTGTWNLNLANFDNTGTLNIDSTAGTVFIDQDTIGASVFRNQGTLNKIGVGQFNIFNIASLTFDNSGTIDIQAGEIFLNNAAILNGTLTGTGPLIWNGGSLSGNLTINPGSILEISSGTHTLSAATTFGGGGTVRWLSGILTGANLTIDSIFEVTGASEKTQNSHTLIHNNASGSSVLDSTGTWNLNFSNFVNAGDLVIDSTSGTVFIDQDTIGGSTFQNTGTIDKNGPGQFNVFNGAVLTFDNDGTLNINTGDVAVLQPFTNDGLIDLAAGATLTGGNATFVNGATGTIQGIGTIVTPAAGLSNLGLLTPGNGNTGTLSVTGSLNLNSGGSYDVQLAPGLVSDQIIVTGNVNINAGAILNVTTLGGYPGNFGDSFTGVITAAGAVNGAFGTVNQPGFTVNPSYVIGPAGDMTLTVGGVFNTWTGAVDSNWLNAGNWSLGVIPDATMDVRINTVGQIITVGGAGTQTINTLGVVSGSAIQFLGANLQLNNNSTVNGDLLIGTTFSGAGDIISNGTFELTNGSLSGVGDIFINNLFSINNTGGVAAINQTVNINPGGTAVWQAGGQNINNLGSGNIQILSGGSFDIQTDATTGLDIGIAAGGSLSKTAAAGSTFLTGNIANNGDINAQAGTLAVTGTFTNNGNINVGNAATFSVPAGFIQNGGTTTLASGATLDVGTNAVDLINAAVLTGVGMVNGDVINTAGTVAPGSSPGIMMISGNYTQGLNGSLAIDVQDPGLTAGADYDQLIIGGSAALNGNLFVTLLGGYEPPQGQTYDILTYASASGDFSNIPDVPLAEGTQPFSGSANGSFYGLTAGAALLPPVTETPVAPDDSLGDEAAAENLNEIIALDENSEFLDNDLDDDGEEDDDENEYKICSGT